MKNRKYHTVGIITKPNIKYKGIFQWLVYIFIMQSSKILKVAVYFPLVSHHNSVVSVELLVVLRRICTTVETHLSRGILLIKCNVLLSM